MQNVFLHNQRMNNSRLMLFGKDNFINLEEEIDLEDDDFDGIFKCRVLYSNAIEIIEILPYQIKKINTLKMVIDNSISYDHKFEDRKEIANLYLKKENCDDVFIIKDGMVTDTSYCNIVFDTGNKLITPSTPLLKGVKRQQLLNEKIIEEQEIKQTDIKLFSKAFLINSMFDLDDKMEIAVKNII
ncbi:MAG: aminotransferase class IV [Bacteroidota bacterium]